MSSTLEIKDLHVSIEDKEILKGVNLTTLVKYTQLWDLMVLVNQHYRQQLWDIQVMKLQGEVLLDGVNILELDVDERAKAGLF